MKVEDTSPSRPPDPTGPSNGGRLADWLARHKLLLNYRWHEALALFDRGSTSLRSRGLGATLRLAGSRLFPAKRQPISLLLYADSVDPREVRLPHADPAVSIIVPVHNQLDFTLRCLRSLSHSGDSTPFEVIVIDDASSDASASVLADIEGLRYQRQDVNCGFIDSCNLGATLARAEFLVFLNNDTVVQPGWLDALLSTFSRHPDTGLAGSKLVYPDGRLQEAGGIIFSDGTAMNYGRNGDPSDPRFNYVREVDYCSGAAIAIRSKDFARLGGFDARYRPAYFEDTDLAMRVRQLGLKVRYQPASVVVHFEGTSSGTSIRRGVKSYQAVNEKKFLDRWSAELKQSHPAPNVGESSERTSSTAANHRARTRLLIIDAHTPKPDRDSGSARMVELMGLLLGEGCSVDFFSEDLAHDGRYSEDLQQLGVQVWWRPWLGQLPDWLRQHGSRFDAIIVSRHYVLSPMLPLLRKLAPQAQIIFDSVDLHFLREHREAEQADNAAARLTALRTREAELGLLRAVDATWVVSAFERDLLMELEPLAKIGIVSNIHATCSESPGFSERDDMVFVGSFRHPPNVDAAHWLVEEIWPIVRQTLPDVRLHLVGADAPESVLSLAQNPGVEVRGHVPDLDRLLDQTRISLAPLRYGAGIKGKINQSLARGLPVVATSCAIEGMFLTDGKDVLRADLAQEFSDAIVRLYDDRNLWHALRLAGLENTRRHFSRETALSVIRPWIAGLN